MFEILIEKFSIENSVLSVGQLSISTLLHYLSIHLKAQLIF